MRINLHIERLVLDGVSLERRQQARLIATIESEIGRLLVSQGVGSVGQSSRHVRALKGPTISIGNDSGPRELGLQISRSVCGGMSRG